MMALVLSVVCVGSTWAMFLPQFVKSRRDGSAGVSVSAWSTLLASRIAVIGYGLVQSDPVQLLAGSLPAVCAVGVVALCLRHADRDSRVRSAVTVGAFTAISFASVAMDSAMLTGAVLMAVAAGSCVPQLRSVRSADDLSGVSVSSWVACGLSSIGWLAYGAMQSDVVIIANNILWFGASIAIVTLVRRSAAATAVQPPLAPVVPLRPTRAIAGFAPVPGPRSVSLGQIIPVRAAA